MRGVVLAVCLAAASCAAKPDDSRFYYQGVYVPGSASISDDGGFVSRASVWTDENLAIAKQAAIFRLKQAAETRGYAYAMLAGSDTSKSFGRQFKMEGVLYPEGSVPQGAVPLAALDSNSLAGPADDIQSAAAVESVATPVSANPVRIRPNPPTSAADVPMVIKAPDFS